MAIKLQVPEAYMPHLGELARLSPESMSALIQGLREERPTIGLSDFAESIADRLSLDKKVAQGILELLSSLHAAREGLGGDISEFVSAFRAAIEETGKPELQPSDWPAFQEAITEAFASESPLSISAKALDLLTNHQRTLLYARVITDLRPIFKTDVADAPAAAVIIHNLKLAYRADGMPGELFVALDSLDVAMLLEVLQRATEKEKSLRSFAEAKGITILEVKQ